MINILVTAVGRGAGQAVIKSLRQSDLDIRIIGTDSDPWATGLYAADKSYLCPMCSDPNFIPKILDICRREGIKLIIPNIDPELIVFAENKSEFKAIGVTVLISDPGTIKICRNKLDTYRFFQAKNLPFVETRLVSALLNHPAMTFPLFIKPIGGTGSSGIDILFSAADLAKYADNADQYIVQDYLIPSSWNISGRDIKRDQVIRHNSPIQRDEFSVQHLVSHSGEIIATFMSSSSLKLGTPVHVTPIWDDTVYEISRKMVEALIPEGLVGPINLECKLTAAGVFFYEINPRFTTLSAVRAMLGFNECAAMVEDIIFSKSAVALKSQLEIDYNSVCSRYVSEIVVKAAAFNRLIDQGELDNTEAGTERL